MTYHKSRMLPGRPHGPSRTAPWLPTWPQGYYIRLKVSWEKKPKSLVRNDNDFLRMSSWNSACFAPLSRVLPGNMIQCLLLQSFTQNKGQRTYEVIKFMKNQMRFHTSFGRIVKYIRIFFRSRPFKPFAYINVNKAKKI